MKFSELVFEPHSIHGGMHAIVAFENGYGASVITGTMFYTRPNAPYELAVLHNGELCYSTYLTDDVLGYLTDVQVEEYLAKIEALPKE